MKLRQPRRSPSIYFRIPAKKLNRSSRISLDFRRYLRHPLTFVSFTWLQATRRYVFSQVFSITRLMIFWEYFGYKYFFYKSRAIRCDCYCCCQWVTGESIWLIDFMDQLYPYEHSCTHVNTSVKCVWTMWARGWKFPSFAYIWHCIVIFDSFLATIHSSYLFSCKLRGACHR